MRESHASLMYAHLLPTWDPYGIECIVLPTWDPYGIECIVLPTLDPPRRINTDALATDMGSLRDLIQIPIQDQLRHLLLN